jgi:hypothetical protein
LAETATAVHETKGGAMSVISDVRSVIQDLLSPDVKATVVKLDGLDQKLAAAAAAVDERLKSQDAIATARHNELLSKLETFNAQHTARYDTIMKALDVDARLKALEKSRQGRKPLPKGKGQDEPKGAREVA